MWGARCSRKHPNTPLTHSFLLLLFVVSFDVLKHYWHRFGRRFSMLGYFLIGAVLFCILKDLRHVLPTRIPQAISCVIILWSMDVRSGDRAVIQLRWVVSRRYLLDGHFAETGRRAPVLVVVHTKSRRFRVCRHTMGQNRRSVTLVAVRRHREYGAIDWLRIHVVVVGGISAWRRHRIQFISWSLHPLSTFIRWLYGSKLIRHIYLHVINVWDRIHWWIEVLSFFTENSRSVLLVVTSICRLTLFKLLHEVTLLKQDFLSFELFLLINIRAWTFVDIVFENTFFYSSIRERHSS